MLQFWIKKKSKIFSCNLWEMTTAYLKVLKPRECIQHLFCFVKSQPHLHSWLDHYLQDYKPPPFGPVTLYSPPNMSGRTRTDILKFKLLRRKKDELMMKKSSDNHHRAAQLPCVCDKVLCTPSSAIKLIYKFCI